mmetsp:Transcript_3689/g.9365  ORF Transcript_3689/g.9365 Transcript_3689/m.9365 type:complete len:113 (+) Transcript_3689:430-768(+)
MGGTLTSQHLAKYAAAAAYLSRRDGGCGALTGGPSSELGIDRQGSRVSSITMADGTSIELGASIIFSGNERQRAHIAGDRCRSQSGACRTAESRQEASNPRVDFSKNASCGK